MTRRPRHARARAATVVGAVGLCLALLASSAAARSIRDSAGRTVEVPDRIERVFAAGPPASILLYILAPERMTGWPNPPTAEERPFIAEPYRDLPALGRLTGRGGTANLEVVVKTKPDLILDFGSVRDTYISLADNVQEQTKIPYVLVDGRFEATPAALRLLGDILDVKREGRAACQVCRGDLRRARCCSCGNAHGQTPARLSRARAGRS